MVRAKQPRSSAHKWEFKARFRRHAFGWKSEPAIQRVKQAVSEIQKVARRDPELAVEGAVSFLERVSPALEQVDSSSGAIGAAVNRAIAELVRVIANAPADHGTRQAWLERLFEALAADETPYIEALGTSWGELCGSKVVASAWADRLLDLTRRALSRDKQRNAFFFGTAACLSALYRAERYAEIVKLLEVDTIWWYKLWAVKALMGLGKKAEAIRYAESCRGPWTDDRHVAALGEEILLSSGLAEEAYQRYGLLANRRGTYLATLRAVAKRYPHKEAGELLSDLVKTTPGEEGKWFAAAKDAGLYAEALALARRTPCDPRTLTRAARDFAKDQPAFAVGAGVLALHWLVQGYGYEITSADVWAAYASTMQAADRNGTTAETRERIKELVVGAAPGGFVAKILGKEFGL
jgi:hypothetical protein